MSAPAIFPFVPKWIRTNFPCTEVTAVRSDLLNCKITRMWADAQRDGRPAEYRWRPLFNVAKFGWRSLLECRAVTLPRRETRWNQLGVSQTRQQIWAFSGPKFTILWRHVEEVWRLTRLFPIVNTCLSCEDMARQICEMVPSSVIFCVLYFQRAACSTFQTWILNSH